MSIMTSSLSISGSISWIRLTAIIAASLWLQVSGSGVFELKIGPLQNEFQLTADGQCCADIGQLATTRSRRPSPRCQSSCRTFFSVCLGHYQTDIVEDLTASCTYGSLTTDVWNASSINHVETVNFTFNFMWPGTFTLIVAAWHDKTGDGPQPGSDRRLISRVKMQRFLNATAARRHEDHVIDFQKHTMRLSYRVMCDVTFYGPGCDATCMPRDDQFGHYYCDDVTGRKVCHGGWSGTYCDKAVCPDGCRGECKVPFTCTCQPGWQGDLCDKCILYPGCQHGSCIEPWQCNCDEGWGGVFCNEDLNYCTTHKPCSNGATCVHTGGPHSMQPTSNDSLSSVYKCYCRNGYGGFNCENELASADDDVTRDLDCRQAEMSCLNGGTCIQSHPTAADINSWTPFLCRCRAGWIGRRCETSSSSGAPSDPTLPIARAAHSSLDDVMIRSVVRGEPPPETTTRRHFERSASTTSSAAAVVDNQSLSSMTSSTSPTGLPTHPTTAAVLDDGKEDGVGGGVAVHWTVLLISLVVVLLIVLPTAAVTALVVVLLRRRRRRKHSVDETTRQQQQPTNNAVRNDVMAVNGRRRDDVMKAKINNMAVVANNGDGDFKARLSTMRVDEKEHPTKMQSSHLGRVCCSTANGGRRLEVWNGQQLLATTLTDCVVVNNNINRVASIACSCDDDDDQSTTNSSRISPDDSTMTSPGSILESFGQRQELPERDCSADRQTVASLNRENERNGDRWQTILRVDTRQPYAV